METVVKQFLFYKFDQRKLECGFTIFGLFENFFINYNVLYNDIKFEEYEKNGFDCVTIQQMRIIMENFLDLKKDRDSILYEF